MKTIIAIAIASIIAIVALASMADTSSEVESKEVVSVTVQGKVGVKISDNLCVVNGQPSVCF